jgi:hypothetical protein
LVDERETPREVGRIKSRLTEDALDALPTKRPLRHVLTFALPMTCDR